ncbi:D-alanyl-D-alanine carboxypeptidase/D-alanyl-D-alanine-endopeptidase [Roseateles oligotrophus]|uniref:D-alanyl-D-alanine carboxypeptidase/D-alanyl-D-alanine endopeptidase n=1 Tax=Roseateles oligotrophus TaxID=1769250 RepID=UPI00161E97B4|nr:D-alanyl-D-alanine carboxypeptidase/D-alanyl-D-alanine-endopeptidase [Roseateles oligotrophus]
MPTPATCSPTAASRRVARVAGFVLALGLSACAQLGPRAELPPELSSALQRVKLPEQALGLVAFPLADRGAGWRVQAETPMQPGSAMKLVTAIVALDRLGANSRGRSDLLVDTALQGDVLPGALYLRGGADTDLDWGALWLMLRQLREQGVREIRGGLVVDRTLFRPARPDLNVPPFDEAPEFPYNLIPDALMLGGGLLNYELAREGSGPLQVRASPAWPGLRFDTRAMGVNDKACKDWGDDWLTPRVSLQADGAEQLIQLQGSFPRDCRQNQALNLLDRQWLAVQAVSQIWRELGGTLAGPGLEAATPAGARVVASHLGRPLAEVMRGGMKRSDNALTRLVFLKLGSTVAAPEEETQAAAARLVQAWFSEKGLDAQGLLLDNGSGLSRTERIKPAQLAALLALAWDSAQAPELLDSLPIAGVDGTLSRRLKGGPAEGRARLKTGTLRNVVALAGYVQDSRKQPWVLVAILNDEQAPAKGRPVLDAAVEWISRQ